MMDKNLARIVTVANQDMDKELSKLIAVAKLKAENKALKAEVAALKGKQA